MKDNSSVFFSTNLYTQDKKQFSDFWMVGWKFTKFLMSCLKLQVRFFLKLCITLQCHDKLFCWNYVKFQLKKLQSSYVSWPWRVMQNFTKNWLVISKITRIWWILTHALKSLKNVRFDWFLLCKEVNVWPKKKAEKLSFMTLKSDRKLEEKRTYGLENDKKNLTNFHQSTRKCQNWDFDGVILSKVENVWA